MKIFIVISLVTFALAVDQEVQVSENEELFEGDIILEDPVKRSVSTPKKSLLWPNGIVYYSFHHTADSLRSQVGAAMAHIQKITCIRFRENSGGSSIQITSTQAGCASHLGRTGGRQILNLGKGCRDFGTIVHELLHSLGLIHEHSRSDRDKYINIIWENVRPGLQKYLVQLSPDQNRILSPFDYDSIMMLGENAYSKSKDLKTIVPLKAGVKLIPTSQKEKE
uniref:Metalloendopeptidase n=1 Tax=Plectreurys tristis TaxID=33319 RepID=A0A0C4W7U1_PLETR|nr:astacin-like protein [Plectreurys tristis]